MEEIILSIISVICLLFASVIGYYLYIKKKLEEEALDAINQAEDTSKVGKEKMEQAIDTVYDALPAVVRPFITRTLIEEIIQRVFDKVEEYAKKQIEKEKVDE